MLLIINNKSVFIEELKAFLKKNGIDFVECLHNSPVEIKNLKDIKGVILSGGPGTPFEPLNLSSNYIALINFNIPILGICLGHEIIGAAFGGKIEKLSELQDKMEKILIKKDDPLLKGVGKDLKLREKHSYHLSEKPKNFSVIAYSKICPFEIIKHKRKPIYGFQSHPEVSGENGKIIIRNFLKMCGFKK